MGIKDVTQSNYQTYMSGIPKPQNAIGDWRIPTELECKTFLSDPATPGIFKNSSENYFCYVEENLNWCHAVKSSDGTITFTLTPSGIIGTVYLRPVIDISYE